MMKAIRVGKSIVLIAIVVFIAMVIVGIYTALNAAPAATLSNSTGNTSASIFSSYAQADTTKVVDEAATNTTPSTTSKKASSASVSTQASPKKSSSSAVKPKTASSKNASSNSGSGKTYYPAWKEWAEEGHWETCTTAAVYGERSVYGSVCNTCKANISGRAAAHLKETQHSGYHEGIVGSEAYEVTPAKTEKVWVDTSHWVKHPAVWK